MEYGKLPELNIRGAIESLGGSDALYERLLRQLERLLPGHLAEMDSHLEKGGIKDFAVAVHGVKGAMRQAGNLELSKSAQDLETAAKESNYDWCLEHYPSFRAGLLDFHSRLSEAVSEEFPGESELCDIADFTGIIEKARAAADDYDALTAAELLEPLRNKTFGTELDALLNEALDFLAAFQASDAAGVLAEILAGE